MTCGASLTNSVTGGRMTWAEAVEGPLIGMICLWQDLDGLHVEAPSTQAPLTSILWAWNASTTMARVRLDGNIAYVALCDNLPSDAALVPWAANDDRVKAVTLADPSLDLESLALEQFVVDGIATGTGPITFIRRRIAATAGQS